MSATLQNLGFFKIGWLACILFAAAGKPAFAALAVAAVVAIHLVRAPVPGKEALFLVSAGMIGLVWESFMVSSGLIEYPVTGHVAPLAPYWIVAMWVLFATTINFGLKWIKRHWMLGVAFGALGGPMAFFSGAAMGAAQFSNPPLALAVIGVGWAVLLPLLALISDMITDSELLEPGVEAKRKPRETGLLAQFQGTIHHA